jgi:hypothetical protein
MQQRNVDVSPAIPFLRKLLEGDRTDLERETAQEARQVLAELDS